MSDTRFDTRSSEWIGDMTVWLRENSGDNAERLSRLKRNLRQARKQELTDALVRVNNELRVLADMRAEQYLEYCKEGAADEAKELDTHMSFSMFERAV